MTEVSGVVHSGFGDEHPVSDAFSKILRPEGFGTYLAERLVSGRFPYPPSHARRIG